MAYNRKSLENLSKGKGKKALGIKAALNEILSSPSIDLRYSVAGEKRHIHIETEAGKGENLAKLSAAAIFLESLKGNVQAFNAIADRTEGKPLMQIQQNDGAHKRDNMVIEIGDFS